MIALLNDFLSHVFMILFIIHITYVPVSYLYYYLIYLYCNYQLQIVNFALNKKKQAINNTIYELLIFYSTSLKSIINMQKNINL